MMWKHSLDSLNSGIYKEPDYVLNCLMRITVIDKLFRNQVKQKIDEQWNFISPKGSVQSDNSNPNKSKLNYSFK